MEPPDDAVETAGGTIWLEDGILVERTRGVTSTAESVTEAFEAFRRLSNGSPRPLLLDSRRWWGGAPAAWTTGIQAAEGTLSAIALLIDHAAGADPGPFPELVDRFVIPFRVFTDEANAMTFLREHLA